jgi:Tol biopolymer transport system component
MQYRVLKDIVFIAGALCVTSVLRPAAYPATLAYVDSEGRLIYQAEDGRRTVVTEGNGEEPSLRHDGTQLVYTRQVNSGAWRTLVHYDAQNRLSRDLISGYVAQPLWSADGGRIAFLRVEAGNTRVWTMDPTAPATATRLSNLAVKTLVGWTPTGDAVIAYDEANLYWIGQDGRVLNTLSSEVLYGKAFEWMSRNQIRVHPSNPDLLSVCAYYATSPAGAPVDEMGLTPTIMLFDLKSKTLKPVLAVSEWGMDANWSPDGQWLHFARGEGEHRMGIWKVHADGSGLERVASGSQVDVAR